jgi:hypothetical protein
MHIISMLQLSFTQTPLLVAHTEERNGIKSTFEQPHFLLCGSCYWCASYFSLRGTVEICPSCMNGKVESMPISDNEIYTFHYSATRGVTLEFRTILN